MVERITSLKFLFKRLGIEARFADGDNVENFVPLIDKNQSNLSGNNW